MKANNKENNIGLFEWAILITLIIYILIKNIN